MINPPIIAIRGAGDLASGVALRLFRAGFKRIVMFEKERPLAVRRSVSFSDIIYNKEHSVEGVSSCLVSTYKQMIDAWDNDMIPVWIDPHLEHLPHIGPEILVDAILAKKNIGTFQHHAPLTIGLGPGFFAGQDVHCVIETQRGHFFGRVMYHGETSANTGIPEPVNGYSTERVLWAQSDGIFTTHLSIGSFVSSDEIIGWLNKKPIYSKISGVVRGLLPHETVVGKGCKIADIDPRSQRDYCDTVSEKALGLGGAVLEAALNHLLYNSHNINTLATETTTHSFQ